MKVTDPVVIGVVGAPHGVRGTVRVRPTGSGQHLREGMEPLVGEIRRRILSSQPTPKGFLLDLEGISGRVEARGLRGEELILDRAELDAPEDDEFYVTDLVGLAAIDESSIGLGNVAETFATAAHEVLVVRDEQGREIYVPFTLEHVPEVRLDTGRVVVHPPEE